MNNLNQNFSYSHFQNILEVIKSNFDQYLFYQAPEALKGNHTKPVILLRHDVDLDLEKA